MIWLEKLCLDLLVLSYFDQQVIQDQRADSLLGKIVF
jgi:hypothetical protein